VSGEIPPLHDFATLSTGDVNDKVLQILDIHKSFCRINLLQIQRSLLVSTLLAIFKVEWRSTGYFSDDTLNYPKVTRHGLGWSLRVRLPQSSHTNHGNTSGQRRLIGECTRALRLCLASSLTTRRMQNRSHFLDAGFPSSGNAEAEYLTRCTNFHITLTSLHYFNSLHAGMTACCRVIQIHLNFSITTRACR